MARRGDRPRPLSTAGRAPLVRELSSGGLVYRRTQGRWMVCLGGRRRPDDGPLVWSIPKGHVEEGESMAEAAAREVHEETGLVAVVDDGHLGDVTYWYARRDPAGNPVRVFKRVRFFLLRHRGGRFADRDHELDAVRWFALPEAEAAVAYASERALVGRARQRLEARPAR